MNTYSVAYGWFFDLNSFHLVTGFKLKIMNQEGNLICWIKAYNKIQEKFALRIMQYFVKSVVIWNKGLLIQIDAKMTFLSPENFFHIFIIFLRKAAKKVLPLVVLPLRFNPPAPSRLVVIGTFYFIFRAPKK